MSIFHSFAGGPRGFAGDRTLFAATSRRSSTTKRGFDAGECRFDAGERVFADGQPDFASREHDFAREKHGFDAGEHDFADERHGFDAGEHDFADERHGFDAGEHDFAGERHGFAAGEHALDAGEVDLDAGEHVFAGGELASRAGEHAFRAGECRFEAGEGVLAGGEHAALAGERLFVDGERRCLRYERAKLAPFPRFEAVMLPSLRIFPALLALLFACEAAPTAAPAVMAGSPAPPIAPPGDALVVQTDRGPLAGKVVEGHVRAFLGIPYAAPPTGALRWRPPAEVAAWSAPRDATRVGAACPQLDAPPYAHTDEDCLSLNVWAPAGGAANKPVLVWIPGGAFVEGSGGYQLYDGARLAAREDAVVVTMNYRIGPLGFLAHRDLAREARRDASPSYGLLDQQAALRWVQRNARTFGGDPGSVTVFGESAGAWSVCAQLAMPGSRGLFARAIMESGACADPLYFGPREAEAQGDRLAAALGCGDVACLRGKSADAVLRALPVKRHFVLPPGVWWAPVVDGTELPALPLEALRAGRGANVPLLIGWNRDEGVAHTFHFDAVTPDERDAFVRDSFGDSAVGPVAERYARPSAKDALTDIVTDGAFACESRRVARVLAAQGLPVYLYEFTHALENAKLRPLGATHSVELWFVFGTEEGGIGLADDELPLSHTMMDAWGRFARRGDPSGAALPWPRYTVAGDELAVLDVAPSTAAHVKSTECDFWDRFERPLR